MLMISIPYRVLEYKGEVQIVVKSLRLSTSGSTFEEAFELLRHGMGEIVSGRITKDSFTFEKINSERGLIISTHWPDLINKVLEHEPLPEIRDTKNERQKRVESQDHLSQLK